MTHDQLLLLHRIMQLKPDEMAELRENYRLYREAVNTLNSVIGRNSHEDVLSKMEAHNLAIARA